MAPCEQALPLTGKRDKVSGRLMTSKVVIWILDRISLHTECQSGSRDKFWDLNFPISSKLWLFATGSINQMSLAPTADKLLIFSILPQ